MPAFVHRSLLFARNVLLLLLLGITLTTCKKENLCDCFKGTGKETTEERSIEPFREVFVTDKVDVHLTQGAEYSLKVVAGKRVIKLIKTRVLDGVLNISDDNACDFTRSYKRKVTVYVTMPDLRRVNNDGVGDTYMDNRFTCDTLNYYQSNSGNMHLDLDADIVYGGMHGNGDVYMKGTVNENVVFAGGQGYFHGFDAVSNRVVLTLNTSGRMEVNVSGGGPMKIDMYARSTGDVYYKGYPSTIYGTISGSGKMLDKN
jgi:hypothetical protein